jgi:hypothetical protein
MLRLVTPQAQVKKTSIQQMWSNDLDRLEQAIRILALQVVQPVLLALAQYFPMFSQYVMT